MKRLLRPIPIAVLCVVLALIGLLAYGLAANEPDRGAEEALAAVSESPRRLSSCRGSTEPAARRWPTTGGRWWC